MKTILLLGLFVPLLSYSQKMKKLEESAELVFYEEKLEEALELYQKIIEKSPSNNTAIYRAEICSLLTKYRNKPLDVILSYTNTQGKNDRFFNYWIGRIYLKKNEFDKAIDSWNKFLSSRSYKSPAIIEEVEDFILRAELAKAKFSHVNDYEIEQLPTKINSASTEYSPVYFEDKGELLFVSSRPTEEANLTDGAFHVYYSVKINDTWTIPVLQDQFGDFTENNANIEVVDNDGKLFLYEDDNKGLYYSELVDDQWSNMKRFDSHLTGEKMKSHFFINEHEDRILFADRRNKRASLDIFESVKDPATGDWTKPYPFSVAINSDGDEDYPYLTPDDKTIYFSSTDHGSIGGYDVFRSDFDSETFTWSNPEALHYPINTPDNDIQFKINEKSKSGYFVSDRLESNGSFDIFFFYNEPKVLLHGDVFDKDGHGISNARLKFTSYTTADAVVTVQTDEKGYFRAYLDEKHRFRVSITSDGKEIHREESSTPTKSESEEKRQNFIISGEYVPLVKKGGEIDNSFTSIQTLGSKFRQSQKAQLRNIYFESNSYQITPDSKSSINELYKIMKEFPKLKIKVEGHTDNIGPHDVNMTFSQKRAESVVAYLVTKGIKKNRLVAEGFGETRPLASNDDEKNGREINRRIEIVVIE